VAFNQEFVGYLVIADHIKEDAQTVIHKLQKDGIHIAMLTGDHTEAANTVAKAVGIQQVYAQMLPDDKLRIVQEMQRQKGVTMFVGDGINDAPVLTGADVGAAMGSGADAAMEAADVVFMNSSLTAILEAMDIARITNRIAIQNIVFALGMKVIVMGLGLFGYANMWMAVFADTGVAMLCVLNSIRILRRK
jgi:Cd2+/Zn2+-exporting ATPase